MTRPLVVVVGAGGIGHPAIAALSDVDVRLRVIDDDRVETSNLHRLPFAEDRDVGSPKADVALRTRAAGRRVDDAAIHDRVTPVTALGHLRGAALVIDACDNYPTRFVIADACGLLGIPSVHGAAVGWIGTVLTVVPSRSACYRCIFEDAPRGDTVDCATAGVYGPVTAVIGALMAADALRILARDERFAGTVGSYDGWRNSFRSVNIARRSGCPLCSTRAIRSLDPERYDSAVRVA